MMIEGKFEFRAAGVEIGYILNVLQWTKRHTSVTSARKKMNAMLFFIYKFSKKYF